MADKLFRVMYHGDNRIDEGRLPVITERKRSSGRKTGGIIKSQNEGKYLSLVEKNKSKNNKVHMMVIDKHIDGKK